MKVMAERLLALRNEKRLSQVKLAEIMGLSQTSINRYENDLGSPSVETLLKYAEYFNVSLDYIFGRTDNPGGEIYRSTSEEIEKHMSKEEWPKFVEACFDPSSPVSERFKEAMLSLLQPNGNE